MSNSHDLVERVWRNILSTQPGEIGCSSAYQRLDRFAEQWLAGEDMARQMPLMWDHLERCPFCREEFETLVRALRLSESWRSSVEHGTGEGQLANPAYDV
ncbi:MAG: hypothetical protein PVI59_08800 [Anaerolineae bacterium]|jgi:hypothetical protein